MTVLGAMALSSSCIPLDVEHVQGESCQLLACKVAFDVAKLFAEPPADIAHLTTIVQMLFYCSQG